MNINCQHCDREIIENFCPNCGQKKFKRINKQYILDEFQYTILHTNKGFLYSVKNIIRNPGQTARTFIEGNRVNHYKPLLLAFVLSGIAAFISFKVIGLQQIMSAYYARQALTSDIINDYLATSSSYSSIIMLALVPVFAFITRISFRKWGHNYYEHVIMNAYIVSFYTIINILLLYPVLYIFRNNDDVFIHLTKISMFIVPFILVWFFMKFYEEKPLTQVAGRVVLTVILTMLIFIITIVLGMLAYLMFIRPEVLEQLRRR